MIIFLLFLFLLFPQTSFAQSTKLDVIDFMRAKFDYNGFTQFNSYLALNIHSYDKVQKKWIHHTELPTCPPEFTCESTNWKAREMTRQKPGENILYLNKGALPVPYKIPETFWYNNDSVYDFEEGYAINPSDAWDPTVYGLFHNLYHTPINNPFIEFPYRGSFWTNRYVTPNDVTPWIYQVHTTQYKNMQLFGAGPFPYYFRIRVEYDPNWDGSQNSWNGQVDTGNLPRPLAVIKLIGEWKDDAGNNKGGETYIYAKSGTDSFGLIRYENWEPKTTACGSTTCCTTPTCDNTNPLTLTMENTYNILRHYDAGEDPNQYFNPAFYSDPKLEAYPGEPTNGALPRGRFQLPGNGQTTDGTQLKAGDWMQLTEILTDSDWMLSSHIPDTQCPNGYQYLGSMATNFYDHREVNQGNNWAIFCGINKNVVLATSCPTNYSPRGWFDAPTISKSAYDYQGNDVTGKRINYCVTYNEFHFPKISITPTTQSKSGDYNHDGTVDLADFSIWKSKYLAGQATLVDFTVWKAAYLQN